ncbi:hypothetical protein [Confluentibacter flavum]|nr:hypothetical protein [Confluentibacter flavum]
MTNIGTAEQINDVLSFRIYFGIHPNLKRDAETIPIAIGTA